MERKRKGRPMKSQEVNLYREIQKNAETAMLAIDTISGKIYDEQLATQVSKQAVKYSQLRNQALDQMLSVKAEPYHSDRISEFSLKAGIHYHTLLNTSTSKLAEVLIKANTDGMVRMNRALNQKYEGCESARKLAGELLRLEAGNVDLLKKYL